MRCHGLPVRLALLILLITYVLLLEHVGDHVFLLLDEAVFLLLPQQLLVELRAHLETLQVLVDVEKLLFMLV